MSYYQKNKEHIIKYNKERYYMLKEIDDDFLKERNELKESQGALSIEGRTFKKSQINGLEVNTKKKSETKESYVLMKDVYNLLFSSEGGRRKTRKIRN
mgnify:CR=1 FL=1